MTLPPPADLLVRLKHRPLYLLQYKPVRTKIDPEFGETSPDTRILKIR